MRKPPILSEDHQVYPWGWRRKISYIIISIWISTLHLLSTLSLPVCWVPYSDIYSRIPFTGSENDNAWITSTRTTINIVPDWKAVWAKPLWTALTQGEGQRYSHRESGALPKEAGKKTLCFSSPTGFSQNVLSPLERGKADAKFKRANSCHVPKLHSN